MKLLFQKHRCATRARAGTHVESFWLKMQEPAALTKQSWKINQYLTKFEKGQVENNYLELQYIPYCNLQPIQ